MYIWPSNIRPVNKILFKNHAGTFFSSEVRGQSWHRKGCVRSSFENANRSSDFQRRIFQVTVHWQLFRSCTGKVRHLIKSYCSNINVKFVFTSFKVRNTFVNKDLIPLSLRSHVVYMSSCTSCNACYLGETHRHCSTRTYEHLRTDKNSHLQTRVQIPQFQSPVITTLSKSLPGHPPSSI